MDLAGVLRAARLEAGLSQQTVADRAGVARHALCRWETGARPVRSDVADRVLAACGRDVRLTLVARLADLDDSLAELAALTVEQRLRTLSELLSYDTLDELQATGGVAFTGSWAALALGLPPLHETGGLVVSPRAAEQVQVSAVLRPLHPKRIAPGGPWGVTWDDAVFERNPTATLYAGLLGRFTCEVATTPVPELRVETSAGPWRVVTPEQLVPETVPAAAVTRWRERAT